MKLALKTLLKTVTNREFGEVHRWQEICEMSKVGGRRDGRSMIVKAMAVSRIEHSTCENEKKTIGY